MKLYYYILGVVLLAFLLGVYYHLGGFRKIEVEKIENALPYEVKIWGKHFDGNVQDEKWKGLFVEIRDMIVDGKLKAPVTVIYLKETPAGDNDKKIEAFIGSQAVPGTQPPDGLQEDSLSFKGVLRVRLTMHPVVMPSPQKVMKVISRYAAMNNLKPESLHIEKYYPDNTLAVEVPFK